MKDLTLILNEHCSEWKTETATLVQLQHFIIMVCGSTGINEKYTLMWKTIIKTDNIRLCWCAQCSCQNCYSFVFYFLFCVKLICEHACDFLHCICNSNNKIIIILSSRSSSFIYSNSFFIYIFFPTLKSHIQTLKSFALQNFIFNSFQCDWKLDLSTLNSGKPECGSSWNNSR